MSQTGDRPSDLRPPGGSKMRSRGRASSAGLTARGGKDTRNRPDLPRE